MAARRLVAYWPIITVLAIAGVSPARAQEFALVRPVTPLPLPQVERNDAAPPMAGPSWQEVLARLERAERELAEMRAAQGYGVTPGLPGAGPAPPFEVAPPLDAPTGVPGQMVSTAFPHPRIHADGNPHVAPVEHRVHLLEKAAGKTDSPEFPKVKLSGFFHVDAGGFSQDEASIATLSNLQNGVGFRRARLQALGSVAEFTNYSIEMDFAQAGRPSFQDVWLEQTHLPLVGAVRIGLFRQPCTMDTYTPIRQLTFLERPLPFQAFDPFRRTGIMAYDKSDDEMTTCQHSIYRTGGFNQAPLLDSRFGNDIGDGGGFSLATRMTHLLWYDECADGRYLLHVGGNFNYGRNTANTLLPSTPYYEARVIPEFFVGDIGIPPNAGFPAASVGTPFFIDTGRIPSRDFEIYGLELAAQYGPVHFQSEYLITTVNQIGGPNLFYDGAYAQVGYFLTGEHRTYNRTFGAFDRVTPFEDFFSIEDMGICGWGAWEVAVRCSYVNLNDPDALPEPNFPASPGRLTNSTLGVNWYWNAHAKLQFNWIHCWLDNAVVGNSDTDIFACRAQVEF